MSPSFLAPGIRAFIMHCSGAETPDKSPEKGEALTESWDFRYRAAMSIMQDSLAITQTP